MTGAENRRSARVPAARHLDETKSSHGRRRARGAVPSTLRHPLRAESGNSAPFRPKRPMASGISASAISRPDPGAVGRIFCAMLQLVAFDFCPSGINSELSGVPALLVPAPNRRRSTPHRHPASRRRNPRSSPRGCRADRYRDPSPRQNTSLRRGYGSWRTQSFPWAPYVSDRRA